MKLTDLSRGADDLVMHFFTMLYDLSRNLSRLRGRLFDILPLEWLHLDGDDSLPVQLDRERVISVLELPFTDPDRFWELP